MNYLKYSATSKTGAPRNTEQYFSKKLYLKEKAEKRRGRDRSDAKEKERERARVVGWNWTKDTQVLVELATVKRALGLLKK